MSLRLGVFVLTVMAFCVMAKPQDRRQILNRRPTQHFSGLNQLFPVLERISSRIRTIDSKLMRHELREVQVAEFLGATLNSVVTALGKSKEKAEVLAAQVAGVEERLMVVVPLIQSSDERQRAMLGKISEGLDTLLLIAMAPKLEENPGAPPPVSLELVEENRKQTEALLGAVDEIRASQTAEFSKVSTEVSALTASLSQQLADVTSHHTDLLTLVQGLAVPTTPAPRDNTCDAMAESLSETLGDLSRQQEGQMLLLQKIQLSTDQGFINQTQDFTSLSEVVKSADINTNKNYDAIVHHLNELKNISHSNFGNLHENLISIVNENDDIQTKLNNMTVSLKDGHASIIGNLDESTDTAENLHATVAENYKLLSEEINALGKIEQVMINTADAVLDTKRSIEFGIQQVILELGDVVSQSSMTMNSTLSDQISSISFNILKNQTSALTNMTRRMEDEISQVWRQIGIMYQQVEQSISMLDSLQVTTNQHMNVSLSRVGSMDGTVGEISGKVTDVEDNLNYLLGRLTLVVSEFNQMKVGVGEELDRLRDMAAGYSTNAGDLEHYSENTIK